MMTPSIYYLLLAIDDHIPIDDNLYILADSRCIDVVQLSYRNSEFFCDMALLQTYPADVGASLTS